MPIVVNYTKSQYEAKISELEGYYKQLEQHLQRMEGLREKMFQFWDDPNARTVGSVLEIQIRQVRNASARTMDMLTFYRNAVSQLDASSSLSNEILEGALSVLGFLGI